MFAGLLSFLFPRFAAAQDFCFNEVNYTPEKTQFAIFAPDDAKKVILEPIDTFFLSTRAAHGAIMRLRDCSPTTTRQAATKAAEFAKRGTPFDFSYDWTNTSRLYCTELIWVAYNSAGVKILQSNNRIKEDHSTNTIVFPSDIASNDSLRVVFSF